jgi:hypothetical protein
MEVPGDDVDAGNRDGPAAGFVVLRRRRRRALYCTSVVMLDAGRVYVSCPFVTVTAGCC